MLKNSKYKAIAESLVMSGSRPNQRNRDLWSPLHVAAKKGQIEAIRWVKMVNEILRELQMETFDFNMPFIQQSLHLAGYSGHYKVVEEILNGSLESLLFLMQEILISKLHDNYLICQTLCQLKSLEKQKRDTQEKIIQNVMNQLSAIKKQNKHNSKLKQRNPPEFKKLNHKQILEKSLRESLQFILGKTYSKEIQIKAYILQETKLKNKQLLQLKQRQDY